MKHYIDKDIIVADIEHRKSKLQSRIAELGSCESNTLGLFQDMELYDDILSFLDTLEAIDPYGECIQYDSIKAGIQAHAETYSFNIESELFNQLSKEQQGLWRKEIEQAVISGGEVGVELAKDPRYEENVEKKNVDLKKEIYDAQKRFGDIDEMGGYRILIFDDEFRDVLRHFYELGLNAKKGEQ